MGRIWMPGGEGSGADLDVTTAAAGDILKGKVIVGPDGEPLTGVLELTGTVADSQVLSEQTYYNTDAKIKRTGTMANQGAKTASLNCGDSYTIPAGYHNGGGKVTANSLASQTGVQSGKTAAGAAQILSGYEGWVNGGRVTGAMANQGAKTESLNCGGSYTIPAGYHNGSGKVTANNLASQTSADAAAGHILSGKTAWVNGSKITGNIVSLAGQTITPSKSQQSVSCSGKYMTGNVVVNAIPSGYLEAAFTSAKSQLWYENRLANFSVIDNLISMNRSDTVVWNLNREIKLVLITVYSTYQSSDGDILNTEHVVRLTPEQPTCSIKPNLINSGSLAARSTAIGTFSYSSSEKNIKFRRSSVSVPSTASKISACVNLVLYA